MSSTQALQRQLLAKPQLLRDAGSEMLIGVLSCIRGAVGDPFPGTPAIHHYRLGLAVFHEAIQDRSHGRGGILMPGK